MKTTDDAFQWAQTFETIAKDGHFSIAQRGRFFGLPRYTPYFHCLCEEYGEGEELNHTAVAFEVDEAVTVKYPELRLGDIVILEIEDKIKCFTNPDDGVFRRLTEARAVGEMDYQ